MSIEIKTKKYIHNGEPYRKIISMKLLHKEQLPKEYIENGPCIYAVPRPGHSSKAYKDWSSFTEFFVCFKSNKVSQASFLEREMHEERFQKFLEFVKLSGNRLRKINMKNKHKYPEHVKGELEMIVI
jgi:hypothetical protein